MLTALLAVLALQQSALPDLPVARSPVALSAVTTPDGRDEYAYDGQPTAPVIRVHPGERLIVTFANALSLPSREPCVMNPCRQSTNLHFHGMHVSPLGAADNILGMLALPGDTLHYVVDIPADHPPGLYWYHPHPHGESDRQIDDGMSGALIVEGIERVAPAVRGLRERILVVRKLHDQWTINGAPRPSIDISPDERQFWRIVNASGDNFLDLDLGTPLRIVALDGEPLGERTVTHVAIPPAGRVEAIVTGPPPGGTLATHAVETGPAGDPNPAAVLADLVPSKTTSQSTPTVKPVTPQTIPSAAQAAAHTPPAATVTFTEDDDGFYINGQRFNPSAGPLFTVRVGTYVHWKIVNATHEIHPFHIHQVHFLTLGPTPTWLDTVTVPEDSSIDVVLDATNPIIRGLSVFHCHMIRHEDKGMMAKVLFE